MAVHKILRSSALTALAGSLSFLAVPSIANARPDGERGDNPTSQRGGGHQRGDSGQQGGEGRGWGERRAAAQVEAAPAAPAPRAEMAPRGERGNDGGRGGGNNGGGWQGRTAPNPQAAPPPVAQARGDERGRGRGEWQGRGSETQGRGGSWSGGNTAPAAPRQTWRNEPNPTQHRETSRGSWSGNNDGRDRNRSYVDPNRNRDDRASWRGDHRGNDGGRYTQDYRRWNRDWRHDNRYNWSWYRDRNRDSYRMQPYYAPYRSYSYRRLSIGFFMDSLFFGADYWINDPWQYRLPEAYGPYRWVRYYDDALLVNFYSGEVVDVINNFFW